MCRFIFYILNAICGQSNLICKPKATSHIISFRFGQSPLKDHICFIKNIEFKWLKGEGIEFNTPVRSMFFTDYNKTLNVVLDDLFGGTESLTVAYRVSFFNARGKEIFKGDFNIEKKEDNSISMYSVVSRRDLSFLNYVYHKYLSKIFQDYRNFSKVPNSKVLYQKDFVELDKARLIFYFTRHRGLKEAVDSLNECLSEINQQEDIPVKINKFFDGRREHIIELQKKYASCERLYSSCASIDCELSNLLMDVLLLIEMKSEIFVDFSAMPLLNNQNIFSAVKEVKVFDLTKTIYIKKGSEFELRLLPKGNIDLYYEKDVWIFNNNIIYVSQDFCKLCRESNWGIKAFNSSDKKKSAILELYRA